MIEPGVLFAGRYDLGALIGSGGMAEVRAGRDTRLDRPVAIKLLRSELASDPGVRRRFEAEARLAARLSHPNVVAVFDCGEDHGVPYLVMERLPGATLRDRIERGGPLSSAEARLLASEVLAALGAAHAAGVIHRDVKPANVLATGDGHWKVADFGIAKAIQAAQGEDPDATATAAIFGTPAYLAPERAYGRTATVESDLYSVAVVLYECLTGLKPLDQPLRAVRSDADPALDAVVQRGLRRDPSQRFHSAKEMAAGLALGGDPTIRLLARPPQRHRAWMGAAAVGAACVAALVVLLLSASNTPRSHAPTYTTTVTTAPATTLPPTTPPTTTVPPSTAPPNPHHGKPGPPGHGGDH